MTYTTYLHQFSKLIYEWLPIIFLSTYSTPVQFKNTSGLCPFQEIEKRWNGARYSLIWDGKSLFHMVQMFSLTVKCTLTVRSSFPFISVDRNLTLAIYHWSKTQKDWNVIWFWSGGSFPFNSIDLISKHYYSLDQYLQHSENNLRAVFGTAQKPRILIN